MKELKGGGKNGKAKTGQVCDLRKRNANLGQGRSNEGDVCDKVREWGISLLPMYGNGLKPLKGGIKMLLETDVYQDAEEVEKEIKVVVLRSPFGEVLEEIKVEYLVSIGRLG